MFTLRPAAARGRTHLSWLDSRHTFSFGDYVDPAHRGFRALRVINDDLIAPATGFGAHPHRDMEIISLVRRGQLTHQDSTGARGVIGPGEIQKMSAGAGIVLSEFIASVTEPVHLYQIWLRPAQAGLPPSYEQQTIPTGSRVLLAGPAGSGALVTLHQDATLSLLRLEAGGRARVELAPGRHAWLQVLDGTVAARNLELTAGDGAALSDEPVVELAATSPAEVLVFDLA